MTEDKNSTIPGGIILNITPALQTCAQLIAAARQKGKETRKPQNDMGSPEANSQADYWGALGELVFCDYLERAGWQPNYVLVSKYPVRRPDIRLFDQEYDCKVCPPGKQYLCINQEQYQKHSGIFYLPLLLDTPTTLRVMAPVSHAQVSTWRLMANGHSPYLSTHVSTLLSLTNLKDLHK